MKISVFSTKAYDKQFLESENSKFGFEFVFHETKLSPATVALATDSEAVCVFVNDDLSAPTIQGLSDVGVRIVALRCAGYNNIDLKSAKACGISVVRVPAYSPHAVAEHALALLLSLNRKLYKSYNRVREGNFSLEGLIGFDVRGKTIGIVGTGKIGSVFAKLMSGFDCEVLGYDPFPSSAFEKTGARYESMETLFSKSDIISLHCPLTPETYHIINRDNIAKMKDGVMLINTSRGPLVETQPLIDALKSGKIGSVGLDVYEEEADLFFEDLSNKVLQDDVFARLMTFPNVLITGHQAFLTSNALTNIAQTTLNNIADIKRKGSCENALEP